MGHQTKVEFLDSRHARVTIEGFVTTHLEIGGECITSLSPVPGIESINSVVNYNSLTGEPFFEVTFSDDATAAQGVAEIAENHGVDVAEGPWQGFVSSITGNVNDGIPNHFVMDVTLAEGVTPHQFIEALRKYGTHITAASQGGHPSDGHAFVRHLGDNPIIVVGGEPSSPARRPLP